MPAVQAGDLLCVNRSVTKSSTTIPTITLDSADWTEVHNDELNVGPTYISGTTRSGATVACYKFATSSSESAPNFTISTTVDFDSTVLMVLRGVNRSARTSITTTILPVAPGISTVVPDVMTVGSSDTVVEFSSLLGFGYTPSTTSATTAYPRGSDGGWTGIVQNDAGGLASVFYRSGSTDGLSRSENDAAYKVITVMRFGGLSGWFVGTIAY
jgi:hypothetical protein